MGGEYRIERCRGCGTYWQGEVPEPEILADLYGNWIEEQQPEPVGDPLATRDGHEILAAQSYLGKVGLRVLDFGMGWAAWVRTAKALGCEAYGADLAGRCVDYARSQGIGTDPVEVDFINAEQVFEHLADPFGELLELKRILKSGGVIKVSVPSPQGMKRGIEKLKAGTAEHADIMPIWPLEHLNCFTREGVRQLGSRVGLTAFKPSARHRWAFLKRGKPGSLKELVRPEYQWAAPNNIYAWLR